MDSSLFTEGTDIFSVYVYVYISLVCYLGWLTRSGSKSFGFFVGGLFFGAGLGQVR